MQLSFPELFTNSTHTRSSFELLRFTLNPLNSHFQLTAVRILSIKMNRNCVHLLWTHFDSLCLSEDL